MYGNTGMSAIIAWVFSLCSVTVWTRFEPSPGKIVLAVGMWIVSICAISLFAKACRIWL